MAMFHINKHGVPAPCRAKKGNCPLGGDDTHFDSKEAAQYFQDKVSESSHGPLPGIGAEEGNHNPLISSWKEKYPREVEEYIKTGVIDDEASTFREKDGFANRTYDKLE